MKDKKQQGKRNRINGAIFERLVRKNLEEKGWLVSKYQNNVEFEDCSKCKEMCSIDKRCGKMIPAKASRFRLSSTGYPDFICFRPTQQHIYPSDIEENLNFKGIKWTSNPFLHEVIFIEVKTNGRLDKLEKQKAKWYLDNHICSKFLVAIKIKEGRKIKIEYLDKGF